MDHNPSQDKTSHPSEPVYSEEEYIQYTVFSATDGHKDMTVSEKKALELINKGLKKGRFIVVLNDDGSSLTSAESCHESRLPEEKKKAKTTFRSKVKKLIKSGKKKIKKISEIQPCSSG